jgi:hypothetical protein
MAKSTQSPLQRIARLETFYWKRGVNVERVNNVKRKILAIKFSDTNREK